MSIRLAPVILLSLFLALYLWGNLDSLVIIRLAEAVHNTISSPVPPSDLRMLMPEGTIIDARAPQGNVKIEWLSNLTRRYSWQNDKKGPWNTSAVSLIPNENGGVYLPGNRSQDLATFFYLKPNFMIAEFEKTGTVAELREWLRDFMDGADAVYTHDGLVVKFLPQQPEIDVVQLRALDSTSLNLPGAEDDAIKVRKDSCPRENVNNHG